MSVFTVFGASGFIGRHLVASLTAQGYDVQTPARGESISAEKNYGHIIYAIGLTGDYRERPYDTVDAHAGLVATILRQARFDSFLYLSSTRVYRGLDPATTAREDTPLPQTPSLDGVYDYSKLLGESLCLGHSNPAVRVARLSNVYGRGMSASLFLGSLLQSLAQDGHVTIQDNAQSAKDYVAIDDVVRVLPDIALSGSARLYNVASGKRTSNQEIADALTDQGMTVDFAKPAPTARIFPMIDTARLRGEFGPSTHLVTEDIPQLLHRQ